MKTLVSAATPSSKLPLSSVAVSSSTALVPASRSCTVACRIGFSSRSSKFRPLQFGTGGGISYCAWPVMITVPPLPPPPGLPLPLPPPAGAPPPPPPPPQAPRAIALTAIAARSSENRREVRPHFAANGFNYGLPRTIEDIKD